MRVVAGRYGSRPLKPVPGLNTRPTTDKIKESIFNILFEIGEGSVVLDLFCGSGAIGIEFLSRGAEKVYFCDFSDDSIKITKRNLENAGLLTKSIIMKKNYMDCLNYFYSNDLKFDYIFLDPPYKYEYIEKTLDYIWNNNILKEDGIIILETNKDIFVENFQVIKEKKYSKIKVVFLERKK